MKTWPIPTERDEALVYERLPCVKAILISDLKAMGWRESWIGHLIWDMRRRALIYISDGIVKKV